MPAKVFSSTPDLAQRAISGHIGPKMPWRAFARLANSAAGEQLLRLTLRPRALFFAYPAEQRFADHFCSARRQALVAWRPYVVGWLKQGEAVSVMAVTSTCESAFTNPDRKDDLARFVQRVEALADRLNVDRIAYAGVLPSVLRARRLHKGHSGEHAVVCRAIATAVNDLLLQLPLLRRVVVLGGRGQVARPLTQLLRGELAAQRHTFGEILVTSVDRGEMLPPEPSLVVNCSLPGALEARAQDIPIGSVVLNEVYPAPSAACVAALRTRGVALHQVAGVRGQASPAFPGEYAQAIPCCAADPDIQPEVITVPLTATSCRVGQPPSTQTCSMQSKVVE